MRVGARTCVLAMGRILWNQDTTRVFWISVNGLYSLWSWLVFEMMKAAHLFFFFPLENRGAQVCITWRSLLSLHQPASIASGRSLLSLRWCWRSSSCRQCVSRSSPKAVAKFLGSSPSPCFRFALGPAQPVPPPIPPSLSSPKKAAGLGKSFVSNGSPSPPSPSRTSNWCPPQKYTLLGGGGGGGSKNRFSGRKEKKVAPFCVVS